MTEQPAKRLLDRERIDKFIAKNLIPTITLLRELVDYGVDLIIKSNEKGGSLVDLIIIGHFFKHAITMLDAVEIQLSRGAVFSAGVSARSMLEAYIYLAWILETDTENRGRQFYVWHLRQKRARVNQFIPGTPEHERFNKHTSTLPDMKDPTKRAILEKKAIKQEAEITAVLTNAKNKSINDEFERLKKRHFDVPWYKPAGPSSIGEMTRKLSLEKEYDFFYSHFSDISHAGAFEEHVKFDGKAVNFEPIRSPKDIRTIVFVVATLAFRIFRLIINKYFPQDIQSFTERYITQWRTPFLSIPEVIIKEE